ncbi:unnamed protein product [Callosobruchus maculatus]|uniref:C2H2-type domain-containing protein n=1 Tax=Callosobruchus maculatus TaxID=64391 RepID=A0A653DA77_CALMS|nr:unnamed protein product [Callosobruchus maculatus]
MDLDSQIMKIKQEKYDEKDIHNEDYIVKLESEHLIEINSHGIKTEINNQEEIDSTTSAFEFVGTESSNEESQFQDTKIKIKREYPDTYTGQLTEKLGSSSSNDTSEHATVYSAWHRIKEEPTTDSWSEVKTEEVDVTEVEVKCEKPESKLTSQQLEDMDSLQLSKLLDIETKVDPTIFSADSYMSLSNDDLLDHVSAGNCVLEQSDSSVTETKILNSQLSRHPGTASRHNIGSRVTCDQSSIIKKTPGKHATYKIHTCKNGDYITTSNSCSDCHTSVHSDSASAVELEICTYCGKTFKRKSLLDYHMVTVHLGHLINTGKMHAGMFKTVTPKQLQRQRKDSREASSTAVFCSETDLTSDNCGLNINAESSQIVTLGDHMSKNKLEHSDPKFDSDTDSNEKVKLDDVISKNNPNIAVTLILVYINVSIAISKLLGKFI